MLNRGKLPGKTIQELREECVVICKDNMRDPFLARICNCPKVEHDNHDTEDNVFAWD